MVPGVGVVVQLHSSVAITKMDRVHNTKPPKTTNIVVSLRDSEPSQKAVPKKGLWFQSTIGGLQSSRVYYVSQWREVYMRNVGF